MRARAVIGANFGDEGKGLVTDYLCSQGAGVVVRFNGGAQAGHTVVAPSGHRHVFGHFGSGGFLGVPTFLSEYFICNPILYFRELEELRKLKFRIPSVYADPACLVTTFADMIINQRLERRRGDARHGSCGVGVNETVERSRVHNLCITMADLWNGPRTIEKKLVEICGKWAEFRTGSLILEATMFEGFLRACELFASMVHPAGIGQCEDPVFEGAQGLLLDQNNSEYYPHVTRSNTGMLNVRKLCEKAGIRDIETYYVSRTYLTRHGAGPLPGEDPSLQYRDDTNSEHPWQGRLRFAPLGGGAFKTRCARDYGDTKGFKFVLTHCDQEAPKAVADLYVYGPTRDEVQKSKD